jgi:hypothetical protein
VEAPFRGVEASWKFGGSNTASLPGLLTCEKRSVLAIFGAENDRDMAKRGDFGCAGGCHG